MTSVFASRVPRASTVPGRSLMRQQKAPPRLGLWSRRSNRFDDVALRESRAVGAQFRPDQTRQRQRREKLNGSLCGITGSTTWTWPTSRTDRPEGPRS
jgi:hypothetical protein